MTEIRALQPAAPAAEPAEQSVPFSIEAEQQLLGALLTNNDVFDRISQLLKPEHFYEPVHTRKNQCDHIC